MLLITVRSLWIRICAITNRVGLRTSGSYRRFCLVCQGLGGINRLGFLKLIEMCGIILEKYVMYLNFIGIANIFIGLERY
jgi:hypothetical protein